MCGCSNINWSINREVGKFPLPLFSSVPHCWECGWWVAEGNDCWVQNGNWSLERVVLGTI